MADYSVSFKKSEWKGRVAYSTYINDAYFIGVIQRSGTQWIGEKNYSNQITGSDQVYGRTRGEVAEKLYELALEKNHNLRINQNRENHSPLVQEAIEASLRKNGKSVFLLASINQFGELHGLAFAHYHYGLWSEIKVIQYDTVVIEVNGLILSYLGNAREWMAHYDKLEAQENKPKIEHYEPTTDSYMLSYDIPIDRENQDTMAVNYYKSEDKQSKTETDIYSYSLATAWVENNAGIDRPLSNDHRRSVGFCCSIRYLKTLTYRCTRNSEYRGHNALGAADLSARQGYYIEATSKAHAVKQMLDKFPYDLQGFTVELWS